MRLASTTPGRGHGVAARHRWHRCGRGRCGLRRQTVKAVYDSNVFRRCTNQEGDGSFRFTPTIRSPFPGSEVQRRHLLRADLRGLHDLLGRERTDPRPQQLCQLAARARRPNIRAFETASGPMDVLNYGDRTPIDEGTTPIPDNDIRRERYHHLFGTTAVDRTRHLAAVAFRHRAIDLQPVRYRATSHGRQQVRSVAFQSFDLRR